jgi:hypothetical protein
MTKHSSPAARVGMAMKARNTTRLRIFHYGENPIIPNPGDLLIVSILGDADSQIEFSVLIPGREMSVFARDANKAALEYEANKDWLSAPATRMVS